MTVGVLRSNPRADGTVTAAYEVKEIPCGTVVEVIGPVEIACCRVNNGGRQPGIYAGDLLSTVRMQDGDVHELLNSGLMFAELRLGDTRKAEWITAGRPSGARLRDLPDSPLWVGDVVNAPCRPGRIPCGDSALWLRSPWAHVVTEIDYLRVNTKRIVGGPFPAYGISRGWMTEYVAAEDVSLISRGNVWKRAHGEPVTFSSLAEESEFARITGNTVEMPNPATDKRLWTVDEALTAIRDGVAHGIVAAPESHSALHAATILHVNAIRFRDEALGARVAAATLKGFPQPATV